jgi:predicted amidohydrolase YtcJ
VHAFTVEAAYASRREQHLGHLAEGMQADLTCFAQDIWTLAPAQLRSAPILATIVGGEIAYEAP